MFHKDYCSFVHGIAGMRSCDELLRRVTIHIQVCSFACQMQSILVNNSLSGKSQRHGQHRRRHIFRQQSDILDKEQQDRRSMLALHEVGKAQAPHCNYDVEYPGFPLNC
jgi:hypothetical protein